MTDSLAIESGEVNASVQVSPDSLELYLAFPDPSRYSRDQLVDLLRDGGYLGPLDELGIDKLSRGDSMGAATRVIVGNAAVAGSDEEFFYHFDSIKPRSRQETETEGREAFSIDHRESRKVDRCEVNDVLVRITRERDPVEGIDVWGRVLEAPKGKDLKLQPGQNVTLGPDGRSLIAAISGVPIREPNGRITVTRALVVNGVNFKSGNIHFDGSVSVEGDIAAGFIVEATGDIEIKGSIEHATVKAGGSIIVKGGVRRQSQLFAAGSIEVRFVDSDSRLEGRATVTVGQDAIQSELIGDEGVFVGGQLVGGYARSAMHIQVTSLGCPRDTPTRAIVERPFTPARIIALKEELGLIVPQDRTGPSAEEIAAQGNSLLRLGTTARVVASRPSMASRALGAAGVPGVARPGSIPPKSASGSIPPPRPGASRPPPADDAPPPSSFGAPQSSHGAPLSSRGAPASSQQGPESAPLSSRSEPPASSARPPLNAFPTPLARPAPPGSTVAPGRNPAFGAAPQGSTVAPGRNPAFAGVAGARPGVPNIRMPGAAAPVAARPGSPTTMPGPASRLAPPRPLGSANIPGARIGLAPGSVTLPKSLLPGSGKSLVTSRIEELSKFATVALYDQIAILPPSANGRIVATTTVRPGVTLVILQVTRPIDMPLGPRAFRMEDAIIHETIIAPGH